MDVKDYKEIFDYNHTVRERYFNKLQKLQWEDIIKDRETRLKSLKDTLLHIIWAEDTWINYTIQGLEDPNRPFPYYKFDGWNIILEYNNQVINKVNRYLDSLLIKSHGNALDTIVHRINNDKIKRAVKIRDVFFHVITEDLHHRGELVALLWQMNVRPPDMGWLSVMEKTDPVWEMPNSR